MGQITKTTLKATLQDGSTVELPEELVQWFQTGCTLVERFGLRRFDIQYRIVQIGHGVVSAGGGEPKYHEVRSDERKTRRTANKLRDEWIRETGQPALVQTGVVMWLTENELDNIPTRSTTDSTNVVVNISSPLI